MDYINLLRKFDSKDQWLQPVGFNRKALLASISSFADKAAQQFGRSFPIKKDVEDATFCAEVVLNEQLVNGCIYQTVARFSNFGNLVTINNPGYDPSECSLVEGILSTAGFIYIPIDLLEGDYDGNLPDKDRISTWQVRYFDYI